MLKVKLPGGQVGTVQGYTAVAHQVIAIVLVDSTLVAAYLQDLTAEKQGEQDDRKYTESMGRSSQARDTSDNSGADGQASSRTAARKGVLRGDAREG